MPAQPAYYIRIADGIGALPRVFGTTLRDMPQAAFCITTISGQGHYLPIVAYTTVEQMYKRGPFYQSKGKGIGPD